MVVFSFFFLSVFLFSMVVLVFRTFVCVCVCVVLSEVFVRVHACVSMFLYSIIPVGGCEKKQVPSFKYS